MESQNFQIIHADDDDDDIQFLTEAIKSLSKNEVEIQAVSNGLELITLLKSGQRRLPDRIVLDINMPVMDGVQALSEIRKDPQLKDIPIFILSTFREHQKLEEVKKLGVRGFFSKPNHLAAYSEIVNTILVGEPFEEI